MKKKTTFLLLSVFSTSVIAAYCPPFSNPLILRDFISGFQQLNATFTTGLNTLDQSVSAALTTERQLLLNAIALKTTQEAMNASSIAHADQEIAKATANAIGAVKQSERLKETAIDFGAAGQGYNPCKVLNERRTITETQVRDKENRPDLIFKEISAGTGKYANPVVAQEQTLKLHHDYFCTSEQVSAGLCMSVGEMSGANLQASTLFEYSSANDKYAIAKTSFINNMVGLPDAPLSANAAKTPRGKEYMRQKVENDAVISPAINSLMAIKSEFTENPNGGEFGQPVKPLRQQYREQVDRYLGHGEEYKNWNRTLVAAPERGVLVEILKEGALELAIMGNKHAQNERIESNLASLVALENKKANSLNKSNIAGSAKAK
ncbi:TPA: hypothetical protein ACN96V_003645 [Acinetobacter baumannii]